MKNSEDPILFKSRNSPASKEQNWTAKFLKSHHSKQKIQLRQNNSFRSKKNPLSTFSGIHQLSTIPPFHQTFAKTPHPKSPSDSAQESNSGENPQDTDTINCGSDTNDNIPLLHTKVSSHSPYRRRLSPFLKHQIQ
uniref:Uncharacterized protein n=1 Tax=Euplotes crassus TaxID=5936 RepID=A0A7S3NVK2_EUPCR|mmetsp:Transcript_24361/g.24267  ORF Transcript_24361/g.24267 Transcript_24361/m.24267 type:complete len:136 (+) Transcript_24361:46-453(+)